MFAIVGLQPVDNLQQHNWKATAAKILTISEFFVIKKIFYK